MASRARRLRDLGRGRDGRDASSRTSASTSATAWSSPTAPRAGPAATARRRRAPAPDPRPARRGAQPRRASPGCWRSRPRSRGCARNASGCGDVEPPVTTGTWIVAGERAARRWRSAVWRAVRRRPVPRHPRASRGATSRRRRDVAGAAAAGADPRRPAGGAGDAAAVLERVLRAVPRHPPGRWATWPTSSPASPTSRSTPSSTSTWSAGSACCGRPRRWCSTRRATRSTRASGAPRTEQVLAALAALDVPNDGQSSHGTDAAVSEPGRPPYSSGHGHDPADEAARSRPLPRALVPVSNVLTGPRRIVPLVD